MSPCAYKYKIRAPPNIARVPVLLVGSTCLVSKYTVKDSRRTSIVFDGNVLDAVHVPDVPIAWSRRVRKGYERCKTPAKEVRKYASGN